MEIAALVTQKTIENVENLSLDDLAYISDVCRYQTLPNELLVKYIETIKPVVLESWKSGEFLEKETASQISTKLAIAFGNVYRYKSDDQELWDCIIEMLQGSLSAKDGPSKLIPMDAHEFVTLTSSLSRSREDNVQLWGLLAKVLVTQMNTKKINS